MRGADGNGGLAEVRAGERWAGKLDRRLDGQTARLVRALHSEPLAFPQIALHDHSGRPGKSHHQPHQSRDSKLSNIVGQNTRRFQGVLAHDDGEPQARSHKRRLFPGKCPALVRRQETICRSHQPGLHRIPGLRTTVLIRTLASRGGCRATAPRARSSRRAAARPGPTDPGPAAS